MATHRSIVRRSSSVAVVVGAILVAINHGDALLRGDFSAGRLVRIVLTVFVPYCVSTHASVCALREEMKAGPQERSAPL